MTPSHSASTRLGATGERIFVMGHVNIGALGGRSADPAQARKVVDEHVARLVAVGAA